MVMYILNVGQEISQTFMKSSLVPKQYLSVATHEEIEET